MLRKVAGTDLRGASANVNIWAPVYEKVWSNPGEGGPLGQHRLMEKRESGKYIN